MAVRFSLPVVFPTGLPVPYLRQVRGMTIKPVNTPTGAIAPAVDRTTQPLPFVFYRRFYIYPLFLAVLVFFGGLRDAVFGQDISELWLQHLKHPVKA